MGRNFTHNLSKIDYSSEESLKRTLKKVFPELDKEGLDRRFQIEKEYIGYSFTVDELTGAKIWKSP